MRYWLYLAGKLAVASGFMFGVWQGLVRWLPEPEPFLSYRVSRFGQDPLWTFVILFFTLASLGLLALILLDQRYRCRTCLRRLRMPLTSGSWPSSFLVGIPKTEYICPYGHGSLRVPELHISGLQPPVWKPNDDLWTQLRKLEENRG
ncbi:MAG: hypothetical protein IRZ15_03345 [Bryobacteraceae bacterium]|nr:hypothetical protein [Bryobacteraceae bacterium]